MSRKFSDLIDPTFAEENAARVASLKKQIDEAMRKNAERFELRDSEAKNMMRRKTDTE